MYNVADEIIFDWFGDMTVGTIKSIDHFYEMVRCLCFC